MPSLPRDLSPMLPLRSDGPFDSRDHVFELKWAGIRSLARIEGARLSLVSQSGRDVTAWFPELAAITSQMKSRGTALDGEIVALGPDGLPDLRLISARLSGGPVEDGNICIFQAYDLLYAGGKRLLDRPLIERKEALAKALSRPGPALAVDFVPDEGLALFEAAADRKLPGIIAKRKQSPYRSGSRSADWLEVPVYESGWFVVGGYALGVGRGAPIAGLLLGEPVLRGRLRYAGLVQGGIAGRLIEPALSSLTADACPFLSMPSVMRLVYWLRPELVCEVKFARREPDGRLRFPVFVTLRPDLSAGDLQLEKAEQSAPRR